jgi:REP element-mobilizing transposase RayT
LLSRNSILRFNKRRFEGAFHRNALHLRVFRLAGVFAKCYLLGMARPPRIPVWLPHECEVIYFLTLCVLPRGNALANEAAWQALRATLARLDQWDVRCAVAMPDHLHLLAAPKQREASVSSFLKWFKRWFNEAHPHAWKWQPGGFDRLLRRKESAHEKWLYMRENPVRAGLVRRWDEWPYQFGFGE